MNSFQFANRESLRNTAKQILNRQGMASENANRVISDAIFSSQNYTNPQLAIIKASSQITQNTTLKETLKYLKSQANKKVQKQAILGELWDTIKNEEKYEGELLEFEIDSNAKNIFAA